MLQDPGGGGKPPYGIGHVPPWAGAPTSPSGPSTPTPAMPDWNSLIGNNPYLLAQQALAAQQLAALKSQMGASAARALINLGDYSLAKQVSGLGIPKSTAGAVEQANTAGTSVLSRLAHDHGLVQKEIPAVLAGRGFYRSGETGYELGNENRQYGLKQGDARQQTLDYLNQLYNNYVNAQFGIQQNSVNAYFQAYQQAMAQYMANGGAAVTGPPDAGPQPGGMGLYDTTHRPPPWGSPAKTASGF